VAHTNWLIPTPFKLYWYDENNTPPATAPIASGVGSIAIGNGAQALSDLMLSFGEQAGDSVTNGIASNFIGAYAGFQATNAQFSNFLGNGAGYQATDANSSNFIGISAGSGATNAANSTFIGTNAGGSATNAQFSNFIGISAGSGATNAANSTFIGSSAGGSATNAANSTFIGTNAGVSDTVDNTAGGTSILIGNDTLTGGFSNSIALGQGAANTASNEFMIGSAAGTLYDIVNPSYPDTRDDSGFTFPTNFVYTDGNGKFLSSPITSSGITRKFRTTVALAAGANVIVHALGLTDTAVMVEVRDGVTGEIIATRVTAETSDDVTIDVTAAVASARITIIG